VVPYLTAAEVAATLAALTACSAPGSRLIVNFQMPGMAVSLGRVLSRLLLASAGRRSPWAKEPWRSTWTSASMGALLTRHGFTVTGDTDMLESARALGTPGRNPQSLSHSRVMTADRP
jgi:O-methyltransferase involved in polyketide biosynthesis